jgi:hypothetical protein
LNWHNNAVTKAGTGEQVHSTVELKVHRVVLLNVHYCVLGLNDHTLRCITECALRSNTALYY